MPAVHTRSSARPAVRLRAAPALDPPFDDESPSGAWPGETDPAQPPDRLASAGRRRLRPREQRPPPASAGPAALPPEALANATPEARRAANRFLGTCLEILNGYRPISHVRPLVHPGNASTISEQLAAVVGRITSERRRATTTAPATDLVRIRRLRVCEPRPGVAEAAAALDSAGRTWAMAFRLEYRRSTWIGTTVQVL